MQNKLCFIVILPPYFLSVFSNSIITQPSWTKCLQIYTQFMAPTERLDNYKLKYSEKTSKLPVLSAPLTQYTEENKSSFVHT